jgi:low temperature requirement protein LtrA
LAASQLAETMAAGHYASALFGFGFASFAICWAWTNFSWFSSAYDTDDWAFRIVTMVQMVGVLVLAAGLPRMFTSIERSGHIDNSVMVLGYVIMRVALVFQWLRAAKGDPARRSVCLIYAATISIAQVGWVVQIVVPLATTAAIVLGSVLVLIEMTGPVLAERRAGGTPWHAHHIAERHSLFTIIALGEGIVGTVAALSAVAGHQGWTLEAVLVGAAGLGLTFGMWWIYYLVPSGEILRRQRDRARVWGYIQVLIVISIVATGAGLHLAAYFIEGTARITALVAVFGVAVPVAAFLGLMSTLSPTWVTETPTPDRRLDVTMRRYGRGRQRRCPRRGCLQRPLACPRPRVGCPGHLSPGQRRGRAYCSPRRGHPPPAETGRAFRDVRQHRHGSRGGLRQRSCTRTEHARAAVA